MKLNRTETQAVITVALIMAIRLMGIFLILPVFSVYTEKYPGADLGLAGVAFGVYALTQCGLQIPFGWASDRIGRKPILITGLLLFTVGSVICGMAENINQLIFARIIQGSGAISSAAIASLGDLTRPEVRAQSFTIVGITIGAAFLIAIIAGPLLAAEIGFSSLFYVLGGLGVLALLITILFFPQIEHIEKEFDRESESRVLGFIRAPEMKKLLLAALMVSLSVNLFIFIYPISWTVLGVSEADLWRVYLIILIPAALLVFPYVRHAEKNGKLRTPTLAAWAFLALSFLIYPLGGTISWILYAAGIAFFFGHTLFQSLLPAFLTQRVPQDMRGATTGVYNLSSFLGAAIGGMSAGYLYQLSPSLPLVFGLLLVVGWGFLGLPNPPADGVRSHTGSANL